jgi:hypothetical protein
VRHQNGYGGGPSLPVVCAAMIAKVTYYLDVISSWCPWAEPSWAELKAHGATSPSALQPLGRGISAATPARQVYPGSLRRLLRFQNNWSAKRTTSRS